MKNKTALRIVALVTIMTALVLGQVARSPAFAAIRLVDLLSLLAAGMGLGIILCTVVAAIKSRQV
jgi:hypothetical protein